MLVKLSFAAVVVTAAVSLSTVDYRHLYNEMYPANGLKRQVLNLCHDAKPTFVRAVEQDRIDCYDSMPNALERAIGWVRTSARLAAMRTPTGVELAEKLMQQAELRHRSAPQGVLLFASAAAADAPNPAICERAEPASPAAAAVPLPVQDPVKDDVRLARRIGGGDRLLAELGIGPKAVHAADAKRREELPVLAMSGSGGPAADADANAGAAPTASLAAGGCAAR